jgi:hypothetical protein
MDIEWIVTGHARFRIEDRHGTAFDHERFIPQPFGRSGLRLWLDGEGHGILVDEKSGTGWRQHTVITALSASMVSANGKGPGQYFTPLPIPSELRDLARRAKAQRHADERVGRREFRNR